MISALLNSLINMLGILGTIPEGWISQVLLVAADVPLYTLTPKFVMNIRELYVLDTQGRCDHDIDTGFGLSSSAARGVGGTATVGTIAFAEGSGIGGMDDWEEPEISTAERAKHSDRQKSEVSS